MGYQHGTSPNPTMSSWGSYPSIYTLGHRAVRDLLHHPHIVEEKVDGSQFSMGLFPILTNRLDSFDEYELRVRSKGAQLLVDAPEKMFTQAVETAKRLTSEAAYDEGRGLMRGWTYRCEYLAKPQHNTLAYDRIPHQHLILFDVSMGDQKWLPYEAKAREAARLGLECVPLLAWDREGGTMTLEQLRRIIETQVSILGGQKIEGIVIKPTVELYGPDHKTLMGKFVSEQFKEAHTSAWKVTSPNSGDILDQLARQYATHARWMKAAQHLREAGRLMGAPQDIPTLMAEVQRDLGQEEKDVITQILWKWAIPHVNRAVTRGLPEWYKERLLAQQFEPGDTVSLKDDIPT